MQIYTINFEIQFREENNFLILRVVSLMSILSFKILHL